MADNPLFAVSRVFFMSGFFAVVVAAIASLWWGVRQAPLAARAATGLTALAVAFLAISLAARAVVAGRMPLANQYEYAVAFALGITSVYLYSERRYRVRAMGMLVLPIAALLLLYASTLPSRVEPLMPALQNNLLLTVHVGVAIFAYGSFAVAFGAAVLYLIGGETKSALLPGRATLDEAGYRAVTIGFPLMGLVIILGSLWASVAWGRFWSWDPKETSSLATWLIYGGYLHARSARGWRGTRSAVLLVLGFAAVLLTFFGNMFFGGLHGYA